MCSVQLLSWLNVGSVYFEVPVLTCMGFFTRTSSPGLNVGIFGPFLWSAYCLIFVYILMTVSLTFRSSSEQQSFMLIVTYQLSINFSALWHNVSAYELICSRFWFLVSSGNAQSLRDPGCGEESHQQLQRWSGSMPWYWASLVLWILKDVQR